MKELLTFGVFIFIISSISSQSNEKCLPMNAPNIIFDECCSLGFDFIPKEVLNKCIAQYPMPQNSAPRGCISECVFKELKISEDGKISKEALKAYFLNVAKTKLELKSAIEEGVDKCTSDGDNRKVPANQTCGTNSGFLIGCFHARILLQCPNMAQKTECNDLKKFATDCGMIMPMKKKF